MHVGYGAVFQNPNNALPDAEVYRNELRLAEMAEPLGFDSIWSVEHHFDDYTMCPDVLQFLSYMAGRTSHVKLGSGVVVLPWHDPIRVAEQVALLDHVSNGRVILGLGRGLARIEYDGFRLDQNEGRNLFVEYAELVLNALENGYMEGGKFTRQPRREIRPRPARSFKGRTYAAAVSPESMPIMAKLGVGLLVIPQKPWDAVKKDFEVYHKVWREVNGTAPPPKPLSGGFCVRRREQGARRRDGDEMDRGELPHRHEALRDDVAGIRHQEELRVLQQRQQVHQKDRPRRCRARLRDADAVGHAGPGAREVRVHSRHDRR